MSEGVTFRYNELSSDIQKEVVRFHAENPDGRSLDQSAKLWFETCFDSWLSGRLNIESSNVRKHFRLDIEIPVHVSDVLVESESDDDAEDYFGGTTVNISRGGLFFISHRPIDHASVLKIVVDMSSLDKVFPSFEAMAMVVRCTQISDGKYGIGLMFSTIYQDDKDTLNLFIFKNIAKYLC
jgi:c-di-GMP-binding flagellar brake protein YcgR